MLKIEEIFEDNRAKKFILDFELKSSPVFVYGLNYITESIIDNYNLDGVISEKVKDKTYRGIPVYNLNSVPNNALVVSTIRGRPITEFEKLRAYQFRVIDCFKFLKYCTKSISGISFWENAEVDYKENRDKYEYVYSILKDDISKNQFYNLINFRLSYDLFYMQGFFSKEDEQYFEDFLKFKNGDVFVDVGGFDGSTTKKFIEHCPDYGKIIYFEPEISNFNISKENLKAYRDIKLFNLGLSDKKQSINFQIDGFSSKISEAGATKIFVDKLDNLIEEKVDFIKIDIEGAEKDAVLGAREVILKYHPKLAICIYHNVNDCWLIPECVFSIRKDYDIYIRHYTENYCETVMFFIPK
jgi:FkbM family methyltransferase